MLKNAKGEKNGKSNKKIYQSVTPISVTAKAMDFITGIAGEKNLMVA